MNRPQRNAVFLFIVMTIAVAASCATGSAGEEIDLNGQWEYQQVADLTFPPPDSWQPTTVPGYLSGYNYEKAWFRKIVLIPSSMAGMRLKLLFGGVKFDSRVYVNGHLVGGLLNGYDPFELDITSEVRFGEENELIVGLSDWTATFSDPVDFSNLEPGENPRDRAENVILAPIGGRYDLYGIWQGVTLRALPELSIQDVFVMPSVRQGRIAVRVRLRNDSSEKQSAALVNEVVDGLKIPLTFPQANVTVGPAQTLDVDVDAEWTLYRPWSPSDPYLYSLHTMLEVNSSPVDDVRTRFGFREFWCEEDSFYLNGTKIHLLATSCWPSNVLMQKEDIRNVLQDVKDGNNVAFRLHTQPWNELWYEVADEVGLLMIVEGAVWCDPRAYRLADPTFWSNFGNHLAAAVRRDRNHPSVVMWSLENELLHCGAGSVYAGTEGELGNLGDLVKAMDPTRPITYEADLDPAGKADVVGLHYPHEFPTYHLWPETAYWMDAPIDLGHAPGGTWQWDRRKPLYIGEFLWVPASSPDGFSILYGDDVYADVAYYRNEVKGWTWRMQIEAYRDYGVNGLCPWTMFEDPATRWGILDLNVNENHLYQVQKAAYHPNAVFMKEYDTRFFVGRRVARTVSVFNDTMQSGEFTLKWSAAGSTYTRALSLAPAEKTQQAFTFDAPATPGDFSLAIELLNGEEIVFSDVKSYSAYREPALSPPPAVRLALYDTDGSTAAIFTEQGIPYRQVADLDAAPYDQIDLLVIGRNSLAEDQVLQVGEASLSAKWDAFVDRGGWIVVLEQTSYPRSMPLSLSLTDHAANFAFPRAPGHPVLAGTSPGDLRWWRQGNRVTAGSISKPAKGNFRVLIDVGSTEGLDHAAMIEIPCGRGGFLCSQVLLVAKFASEPMASILLQRILSYCSASRPGLRHAGLVAEADSDVAGTLARLGLRYENLLGRLAVNDLAAYPLLVIAGGENAWTEAEGNLDKLLAYVEAGGKLHLHRPSAAFLTRVGESVAPTLEAVPNAAVPLLRDPSSRDASGLTNYDLYWIDTPGTWNRAATLFEGIAERVYRKRFTLTTYTTVEIENMPVRTGGSAIAGGWNMNVNGYVAQSIVVPESASYLFGVLARGTQAFGEYPRMVLRVDGKSRDAAIVDSETWRQYTLAADLTAGEHEIALAFTNDAWDPPDDRNLYMDRMRYGPDPSPATELFITRPGAVVRVNRGKGFILLDEIAWEAEQKNRTKADRIISILLTEMAAAMRSPAGLRIEAEEMNPVGFGYIRISDGIAWCGSNGRLESSVRFTTSAMYSFDVTAFGDPALGVYPELELRIDGTKRDSVFVNAESPHSFVLQATVPEGDHTVALAFVNDYYDPPEDRNLALDRVVVSCDRQTSPEFVNIVVGKPSGTATLVWEGTAGGEYAVEFSGDLVGDTWRPAGGVAGNSELISWVDDGISTGSLPGDPLTRRRYYRLKETLLPLSASSR